MKIHSDPDAQRTGFTATPGHAWARKNDPLVSIIILRSFNEAWALADTLRAVQAQEYKHWELIVIDSGSTDGSVDLIRRVLPRRIKSARLSNSRIGDNQFPMLRDPHKPAALIEDERKVADRFRAQIRLSPCAARQARNGSVSNRLFACG